MKQGRNTKGTSTEFIMCDLKNDPKQIRQNKEHILEINFTHFYEIHIYF